MKKKPTVGIIGGGIGGVALATALMRKGIPFHLFERAPAFGEVGAGLQMTPNAVKVLKALGKEKELQQYGFLPEAMVGRNYDTGNEVFRSPLKGKFEEVFGAEYYQLHRADLHALFSDELPRENVTLGVVCTGVEQRGDRAVARFEDGSEFEADLIVGADGVRSTVRTALWGKDDPKYMGDMCWRALAPVDKFPLPFVEPNCNIWFGPKGHVVTYYVKGGKMVNIVAIKENPEWVVESWSEASTKEELLDAFKGWHPDLIKLFELTDSKQVFKWGFYGREPMKRWSKGSFTLLGDAAHPMVPYLSQGAAMAIEDAYVLAEALDYFDGKIEPALEAYEEERRPRTARVQIESLERGRWYHLESEEEQRKRDERMRSRVAQNPNAVGNSAEWVYEYDATTCRERFGKKASA